MNKKGQIVSFIVVILILAIIGVTFLFVNKLSDGIFTELDDYLNRTDEFRGSEAQIAAQDINTINNTIWDYAFLGIFIGFVLSLMISAFSTRISPVFYWFYGILAIFFLIFAVMGGLLWQSIAENPSLTDEVARFPITDAILGSNYPVVIAVVLILFIIVLFGKRPTEGQLQ